MSDPAAAQVSLEERIKQLEETVKLRTEQLMSSTSNAYSFLDSLHMGFIMCDVNPEVVVTNDSVQKMLGLDKYSLEVIDAALKPELELRQEIIKSLGSNASKEFEEVNYGKQILRLFIAPIVNEVKGEKQQIGAVILVEDVTEQKVLERAKDEFFFIASHELRTPLTAIRGNSSLIKTYYAQYLKDKDMAEMVDDIHSSAVRLIEIVNDFLDVSALEQGKIQMRPERFALADVAGEVLRELGSVTHAKGVKLVLDPSMESAPQILADRQRMKQVIYNLVGNANKFTANGSITLSARVSDTTVECLVTDTGTGMSEENQRLLFRKFQQAGDSLLTRDATKGTGLGLYISKLIVEKTGGRIGLVRSEPGKGSTFVFSVPRAKN
jgi:signal transduction histidine kinase